MEELEKLRKEIDKLDKMIAELISKRQGLSNKILEAKGGEFTYDPVRERKVMEKFSLTISILNLQKEYGDKLYLLICQNKKN